VRIPIDRDHATPLYRQVEAALRSGIEAGTLSPGTRLPATRALARELGVSRITVGNAYAELERDGLVEAFIGSGTVVSAVRATARAHGPREWPRWQQQLEVNDPAHRQDEDDAGATLLGRPNVVSFTGVGDLRLLSMRDLGAAIRDVLRHDGVEALGYGDLGAGQPALRIAVARVLAAQGITASADQILVTSGSQQGLALTCQAVLRPGDPVLVEQPTYDHALRLFAHLRCPVVGVPVGDDGMRVDLVEDLVRRHRPKLIYTVPTFQNPTGTCLPAHRRRELLALARRHDLPLVEDDFAGDLRYDGRTQPAIKALDRHGQVIHLGTFAKLLAPGLRIGYLVADGPVLRRLTAQKRALDLTTSPLLQRAVERFVTVGRYQAHLRRTTRIYRLRRDAMMDGLARELPGCVVRRPTGGLFAWVRLPDGISARILARAAAGAGVVIAPGTRFFIEPNDGDGHIRLNFATRTEEEIRDGLARLGRTMTDLIDDNRASIMRSHDR
jgi:GntR family transcriptional regulator / MocR family aminotransferase